MAKKNIASEHNIHIEFSVVCTRQFMRKIIDKLIGILDKMGVSATVIHQEMTETDPVDEEKEIEE